MEIKIQKVNESAIIPKYVHEGDAGMDLFSVEDYVLEAGERKLISTGLIFEIPNGFEMQIRPKSGLALKYGLSVLNTPGTVDSGYRGEVGVILINHGKEKYIVKKGEKIAQAVFMKFEKVDLIESQNLSDSIRSTGGFGSTGVKS
ncbi:MAG: dUTP diphosphatase [Nanoarchaeota archaeon]|nr:dUTP diphosphatase [Nanoarchaeota archaeon]